MRDREDAHDTEDERQGDADRTLVRIGVERDGIVVVRFASDARDDIEKIRNVKVGVQTPSGATAFVPLSALATITLDNGASWIYHESTQRFIPVKFSVRDRDLGGAVSEAQQKIAKNVALPTGYRLVWAGEFGELQAAKQRLEIIVPISLVLILALLYGSPCSAYRSWMACS